MFDLRSTRFGPRTARVVGTLSLLMVAGCGLFGGDSRMSDALNRDLAYVAPDARAVASVEPRAMSDGLREFMRAVDPRLATLVDSMESKFSEETQGMPLDPTRDLDRVVLFAADRDRFGMIARGAYDADEMAAFIDREVPDSVLISGSVGERRWTMGRESRVATLSLVAPDLVILSQGSEPAAPGAGPDDELRSLISAVAGYPAWFALREVPALDGASDSPGQGPGWTGAAILSTVRHVAGGARSESDRMEGALMLWPTEGVNAADLADLVEGAIALVLGDDSLPVEVRERLESIEVDTPDDHVRIRGRVAPTDLQAIIGMGAGLMAGASKRHDRT